jgi:penicillin-binding protein 2
VEIRKAEEQETQAEIPLHLEKKDDPTFATGKIAVFQYAAVVVFLFLITGFWELQVRNPEFYSERAERNRIKALPILAPRGKILDRDGRLIVDNRSTFSLILSRENLKPDHIRWIADGLNLDYEELMARLKRFESRPPYDPIVIKEDLTPAEVAFVESHRDPDTFPEMELIPGQKRLYPEGGFAAHVAGYVGEISDPELNSIEFAHLGPCDVIGKTGLERQYNELLMGVDGQRQVVVDNMGRERGVIGMKEAIPGRNLQLTIDLDVQTIAELAMDGRKGAVVALDPRSGEVLAMVSRPAFDPNKFAGRIRSSDWLEIMQNPDNPMLNRAIQAQLAPGSTFKPIMAWAGLETGIIDDGFGASCGGGATYYGRYFKCHKRGGHGRVGLNKAIAQSCDVFFYNLGNRLGIDTIAQYSEMAGLGRRTGIDLPNEERGLVPSSTWKIRNFRQKWYAGETISVAIGQGALTVTPLQLAHSTGGLVSGGVWYPPHLVKNNRRTYKPRVVEAQAEYITRIVDGMYAVVNEGGTGGRARIPGIEVSGKTGTSQLASNALLARLNRADLRDNAWFVGFAPRMNPEIVVAALFEQGEHGHLAAPIVRDVIKAYFDKQERIKKQPLVARAPATQSSAPAQP